MSRASTSCSPKAFGSAPETSASPPVLAKGTASEVRIATRIYQTESHKEAHKAQNDLENHLCFLCLFVAILALHGGQELGVRFRLLKSLEHDFHLLNGRERIQHASHHPNAIEIFFADEQLFLARSRTLQIDRGEQSLI